MALTRMTGKPIQRWRFFAYRLFIIAMKGVRAEGKFAIWFRTFAIRVWPTAVHWHLSMLDAWGTNSHLRATVRRERSLKRRELLFTQSQGLWKKQRKPSACEGPWVRRFWVPPQPPLKKARSLWDRA